MEFPDKIKNVLQTYGIQIDASKDYNADDLKIVYEKIILFLHKKLMYQSVTDIPATSCKIDLEALSVFIHNEFETLGFDAQLEKYNAGYLSTQHQEEVNVICIALVDISRANSIDIPQLYIDIVANYGVIPSYALGANS